MKRLVLTVSLFVLSAATASAQSSSPQPSPSAYGPSEGSWEFTLGGSGSNNNDFDSGSFGVTGSVGKYFTRDFEVSLRQSVNWASVKNGSDNLNGSTRAAADYHFNVTDRFRPFVGANFGGTYGDNVNDTFIAGPEVGVKYYLNPTTFVLGQAEYQVFFDHGSDFDNNFGDGAFAYTVGLGLNF